LHASSRLGKNNTCLVLSNLILEEDGSYNCKGVKLALPERYNLILLEIEAIVNLFNFGKGSAQLDAKLAALREVVPIDFPYAITTHKS
jgi:hypothetical protein